MKTLKIALIVSFIALMFLSSSLVTALNTNDLTAVTVFAQDKDNLYPGESVTLRVRFESNNSAPLEFTSVGIHFDWMPTDAFIGHNLTSTPVTVVAGGEPYTCDPITITVPSDATNGSHSFFIGVDGTEGTDATPFSYSSPTGIVQVISSSTGTTPTPTASPGGSDQTTGTPNLLVYGSIIAVVAVVVVVVVLMLMRKRRRQPAPTPAQAPVTQQPPSTPGGENYDI